MNAEAALLGRQVLLAFFESARQQKMLALPLALQESPFQRA